jgi:ABC-type multidrug transport system ATPase subunit
VSHTHCHTQRTNIGIALISDPRVLFLDEPTSGLDSFSANEVVALARDLARSGVTVVATIHSPTAAAFAMFDRVLVLSRGSTVFFGPNAGEDALPTALRGVHPQLNCTETYLTSLSLLYLR